MSEYVFFFGETKTNGFLSNFYFSSFIEDEQVFICNEQYMMYRKAKLFDDKINMKRILKCSTPLEAKRYGRKVKNFDDKIWFENRIQIVTDGLRLKFTQNLDLKKKLLDTNDKILVEASPYDKIWGIGLNVREAMVTEQKDWPGQNLLGKCLMQVREELRCLTN